MGYDISALPAFVRQESTQFFSRSVLGSVLSSMMNVRTNIKSSEALPTLALTNDLFQADTSCGFNDGGNDLVIDQRTLTVQKIKIQEKFCIKDLEPFFTQEILTPGSTYGESMPPELRFMELIVERIKKTMELAIIEGELGGGNGNASLNLFDGMDHIIANEITALNIPVPQQLSGATTATNIIATLDAMYDILPDDNKLSVAQDKDWVFLVSPQTKIIYERDFRTTHGALPYNTGFDKDHYDTTGIKIVAVAGLTANPGQVILTRMTNWWQGVDIAGEETSLTLEEGAGSEKGFLFLEGHFKMGIQVMFPDEMVVNGY